MPSSAIAPTRSSAQILPLRELDRLGRPEAGRIAGVRARDHAQRERAIAHGAGERAHLVERAGERHHAVAGDGAVGRLHADDAAQRGRLADRAAGVRPQRERRHAGRHGGRRAAARAAGDALAVPGVARRAVGGVLGRRAHRELVHVGLAELDEPLGLAAAHHGRRVGRPVALQHARSRRRRHAADAEQILVGDRARPRCRCGRPASSARACASTRSWSTCRNTFRSSLSASRRRQVGRSRPPRS